jgi:phosphate transport system permease protein
LPVVIISSQEALRAVPSTLRDGARGLGATPWQVIWNVTLPASVPGMMTGIILAMSRAIGEAAPILIIAGIVYINRAPQHLMDDFSVMPMQIFNWTARPQEEFHGLAAAAIVVLMAILMVFNGLAIWIRLKFQKPLS